MKSTQFKKGQKAINEKTDGHISIRRNKKRKPYVYIRVAKNKWVLFHRYVWEQTVGEIPKGLNVQFADKNTLNCDASNLYVIDRQHQIIQNSIIRYTPELQALFRLAGKLRRKIKQYERQD